MRKPDKSSLRRALMKEGQAIGKDQIPSDAVFVINGGALLHRVRWIKDVTFLVNVADDTDVAMMLIYH